MPPMSASSIDSSPSVPMSATGTTGAPPFCAISDTPFLAFRSAPVLPRVAPPFREDRDRLPSLERLHRAPQRLDVQMTRPDEDRLHRIHPQPRQRRRLQLHARQERHLLRAQRPRERDAVRVRQVVADEQARTVGDEPSSLNFLGREQPPRRVEEPTRRWLAHSTREAARALWPGRGTWTPYPFGDVPTRVPSPESWPCPHPYRSRRPAADRPPLSL